MTDEDPNKKGSEDEKTEEKSTRDGFIEFLTSTGRIKPALARSLFEQGLDSHEKLASGDEDYFKTFKRVGPATAEALLELAKMKITKVDKTLKGDELRELLLGIPRIGAAQVESIFSAGYDTGRSIVDGGVEGLCTVKGIGKGKAEAIIKAVEPLIPLEEEGAEIEDATGALHEGEDQAESEGDGEGFFSRIIKKIKGIFKKDDADEPEEKAEEEPPVVEEEPSGEDVESPAEDESSEEKTDEAAQEEPPAEEKPAEEPPVDEKPADDEDAVAEEPPVEETADDEAEKSDEEEKAEEEPETDKEEVEEEGEKKGFFAKITGFFKKDKKEASEEEKPAEEEKEAPPEEEVPEEKPQEADETPAKEKVEDEKPDEEPPVEEESPVKEEKVPIENFNDIPGISSTVADKLYEAGYSSMEELREAVWDDLVLIEGIGEKTAKKIVDAVSNC